MTGNSHGCATSTTGTFRSTYWADQEIGITLPVGWHKRDEQNASFSFDGPDDGRLQIDIVTTSEPIQVDKSLAADLDVSMTRQREGAVDEAHYLVLDGVKGNFIRMNATSQRPIRLELTSSKGCRARTWTRRSTLPKSMRP